MFKSKRWALTIILIILALSVSIMTKFGYFPIFFIAIMLVAIWLELVNINGKIIDTHIMMTIKDNRIPDFLDPPSPPPTKDAVVEVNRRSKSFQPESEERKNNLDENTPGTIDGNTVWL